MMRHTLPSTPAEVFNASSLTCKFKLWLMVRLARLFGLWDKPLPNAAAMSEEMSLTDVFHWVYKSTHPVAKPENENLAETLRQSGHQPIGLPQDFIRQYALTIGAAGDLFQADGLAYSRNILFENVADLLFDQTISFANLESPVTTQKLQQEILSDVAPPVECCSRQQFDVLTEHKGKRFTVLNVANNHMADMGIEGLETTRLACADTGIMDIGMNHGPHELGRGKVLTRNGIKLGFVSATFGLNGRTLPAGEDQHINTAKLLSRTAAPDLRPLQRQIDDCKRQGCDFIVASLHWGHEFEFFPRSRQVEIAHALVEYGADAILGHHPHVIQPVEYYRTHRDSGRIAVIAYSLGSLVWGYTAPHIALSMILNLQLVQGSYQGRKVTYIEQAKATPVFRSTIMDQNGRPLTRIEKLADHIDGRCSDHPQEYVAAISRYADLVLRIKDSA